MRRLGLLYLLLLATTTLMAVPAVPGVVEIMQEDGTILHMRIFGDEYGSYCMTDDGLMVGCNANNVYEYLSLNGNSLVLSGVLAHDLKARTLSELAFIKTLPKQDELVIKIGERHTINKNSKGIA